MALKEQQYQILKARNTRALGTSLLFIPELPVLVLTKRHVGSGNEIAQFTARTYYKFKMAANTRDNANLIFSYSKRMRGLPVCFQP